MSGFFFLSSLLDIMLFIYYCKVNLTGSDKLKNKVYEYRKENKMTQSELSRLVNVSRQTINSIERYKFNPTLVLAHKLSQVFNVSIDDLFIFEDDENIDLTEVKSKKKD